MRKITYSILLFISILICPEEVFANAGPNNNSNIPLADDHSIEYYVEKLKIDKRKYIEITSWNYDGETFTEDDIPENISFQKETNTSTSSIEHSSITIVSIEDESIDKKYTYIIYDFELEKVNDWHVAKRIDSDDVLFALIEGRGDSYDPKYHDCTFESEVYHNGISRTYESSDIATSSNNDFHIFGVEADAFYDNRGGGFYRGPVEGIGQYSFSIILLEKIPNVDFIAYKKSTTAEHEFWSYGYKNGGSYNSYGKQIPYDRWAKLKDGNTLLYVNKACNFTFILNDFLSSETPEGTLVFLERKSDRCHIPIWKRTTDGTFKICFDQAIVHSADYTIEQKDGKFILTFKPEYPKFGKNEKRTFLLLGAENVTPGSHWYQTELIDE